MPSSILKLDTELSAAFFDDHPLPGFIVKAADLQVIRFNKSAQQLLLHHNNLENLYLPLLFSASQQSCITSLLQQQQFSYLSTLVYNLDKGCENVPVQIMANACGLQAEVYYNITLQVASTAAANKALDETNSNKEKIKLLANLVEETSDVLTAADLQFRPVSWNKASERIYGITAEQAIGHDLRQYFDLTYPNTTRDAVRTAIKEQGAWRGEMVFTRPADSKKMTLLTTFKALHDEGDNHIGYVIAATDISDRKEQELKIKESENRFRYLADATPVGIWMSDTANQIYYVNKQLQQYTGIAPADFSSQTWTRLIHPQDRSKATAKPESQALQPKTLTHIYRLQKHTGEYRWMQDTITPRFMEDGTLVGYIGSVVDINDTKIREEQLQYQALLLENVQDVIITTDLEYNICTWNKVAEQIYGCTAKEAVGKRMGDLVKFTYIATTREAAIRHLTATGKWQGEVMYEDKSGNKRYLLQTITYFFDREGARAGIMAVGREITDRKEAEEKLQKSELFYRNLTADSLDGIILTNATGFITFIGPSVKHILGYEINDVLGKNAFEFVHPDDILWAFSSFEKEVEEAPEIKSISIRLRKKSGEWLWCMVRGNNLLNNPHIGGVAIYFHDDSLRKKASEALKASEKRFRNLIRDLQVGVVLCNSTGITLMCNRAMAEMVDTREEDMMGKSIYDVLSDDFVQEDEAYMPLERRPLSIVIKNKMPVRDVVLGYKHNAADERRWVMINIDPILDESGQILHIIYTVKDITDRKNLEKKLLAEKISHQKAITQAAIDGQEKERREIGKELHDNIGQQLTTTKLYLDLAKTTADDNTAEMISLAIKSVSDAINEVRNMSHALVPPSLGDLGIIESINELIESIRYVQLLQIEFDFFDFNEDRVPENVQLMLYRIIQAQLNNIVKHAAASMVNIIIKNNGKKLSLEIKDNGVGFNKKTVRKGLGLTNIKNRAELFGGKVDIVTAPGSGCTISVTIPDKVEPVLQ